MGSPVVSAYDLKHNPLVDKCPASYYINNQAAWGRAKTRERSQGTDKHRNVKKRQERRKDKETNNKAPERFREGKEGWIDD